MNLQLLYNNLPYSAQAFCFNAFANKLHFQRYGKNFHNIMEHLRGTQYYSDDQINSYQNNKLKSLINHAYETVPYYRELFDTNKLKPKDIQTTADLYKIPILTKEDLKKYKHQLISKKIKKWELIHGHTSGTTGTPLDFYWDINTCIYNNAFDWRQKEWAGIKYGDPIALLLGRIIVSPKKYRPPFWQLDYLHNNLWMSSFHLKEEYLQHYFDKLFTFKPFALEGYPSTLYILARYASSKGIILPLKAVFTSSETLYDIQKEAIEKAFNCKVFDYYGMAERVIFATTCQHHDGHHLNFEYAINEFVDSEHHPVNNNVQGYIVGTSLLNFAMPFIRYKTNDVSSLLLHTCKCGRHMPLINAVTTKAEDIVVTPDGRMVSPSILTHPFKPLVNIKESQIVQEDINNLVVNIVRRDGYSGNDTKHLVSALAERVGNEINIEINFVDEIKRSQNGKFHWVISKVKLPL
jgi:phenylacetate-CoA ligase